MKNSWAPEKAQKQTWSLWRHLFWLLWIYITCPATSVHAKQCFTVRCCRQSRGHFALEYFLGKKTQSHAVPSGVVASSTLSGPFCSCLATREGRRRRRRRMWEHGGTWRSRLSVANRLAKSALGSLELLHCNRSSALALFRWLSAEGEDDDPALILHEFYPNMNPLALPELFFLSGNKWGKKQDWSVHRAYLWCLSYTVWLSSVPWLKGSQRSIQLSCPFRTWCFSLRFCTRCSPRLSKGLKTLEDEVGFSNSRKQTSEKAEVSISS